MHRNFSTYTFSPYSTGSALLNYEVRNSLGSILESHARHTDIRFLVEVYLIWYIYRGDEETNIRFFFLK